MSDRSFLALCPNPRVAFSPLLLVLAPALWVGSAAAADEAKPAAESRTAVAESVSPAGTLLRREAPEKPWEFVPKGSPIQSGDLVLGTEAGTFDSKDGAVRMHFFP